MKTQTVAGKQTNAAIIQQAFDDFANGDIQRIVEKCTDDVTWASYDNQKVPYAGTFKGKEGVLQFFKRLADSVDYSEFKPGTFFSDDKQDAVLVHGHHAGKVKLTGKTFSHDWFMEFHLRDGKVYSYFAFVDSNDQAMAFTQNLN